MRKATSHRWVGLRRLRRLLTRLGSRHAKNAARQSRIQVESSCGKQVRPSQVWSRRVRLREACGKANPVKTSTVRADVQVPERKRMTRDSQRGRNHLECAN